MIEQSRGQIQSGDAALKGDADWGMRRLAYEIDHRTEAQYHLFQFEASPDVSTSLDRSLSIDDAVLRFRTIRLPGKRPSRRRRRRRRPPSRAAAARTGAAGAAATTGAAGQPLRRHAGRRRRRSPGRGTAEAPRQGRRGNPPRNRRGSAGRGRRCAAAPATRRHPRQSAPNRPPKRLRPAARRRDHQPSGFSLRIVSVPRGARSPCLDLHCQVVC